MISDKTAKEHFKSIRQTLRSKQQDVEGKNEQEYHRVLEKLSDAITSYEARKKEINEEFTTNMQTVVGQFSQHVMEMNEFSKKGGEELRQQWEDIEPKMQALAEIKRILKTFGKRR